MYCWSKKHKTPKKGLHNQGPFIWQKKRVPIQWFRKSNGKNVLPALRLFVSSLQWVFLLQKLSKGSTVQSTRRCWRKEFSYKSVINHQLVPRSEIISLPYCYCKSLAKAQLRQCLCSWLLWVAKDLSILQFSFRWYGFSLVEPALARPKQASKTRQHKLS